MERQVIVIGSASKTSAQESDSYFASRPRGSQIGAWASAQSDELSSRDELEKRYAEFEKKVKPSAVKSFSKTVLLLGWCSTSVDKTMAFASTTISFAAASLSQELNKSIGLAASSLSIKPCSPY